MEVRHFRNGDLLAEASKPKPRDCTPTREPREGNSASFRGATMAVAPSPDPRMPATDLKARLANTVLLPFLNGLVATVPFLKKDKDRHNEDTLKAHADAKGKDTHGSAWFEEFLSKSKFSVIVFYRGAW